MTTDDVILAGFAADQQYEGVLKVVGKGFTDEIYGVGLPKGSDEHGDEGERRAEGLHRGRLVEDGAGQHGRAVRLLAAEPTHPGYRLTGLG